MTITQPRLRVRTLRYPMRTVWATFSGMSYARPEGPRRDTWQSAPGERAEQTTPETQQATILIVEDEETIAETLAMIVEDAGHAPLVALDGRQALALARQHRPQLIITDLMMPYLNGADLIAAIRHDAAAAGTEAPPIIVVTAVSRAKAQEAGGDLVITKPFDVATIEEAMLRLLQPGSE